jgi:hypothetical protein
MKKYVVIYHSTKKIECITILWWDLILLFVQLTSKLTSTFSCTLYHAFTQKGWSLFTNMLSIPNFPHKDDIDRERAKTGEDYHRIR